CHEDLGEEAAAKADQKLADTMPRTLPVDHFLYGLNAKKAGHLTIAVRAYEDALRLDPTHYWSLMQIGVAWVDGKGQEDFAKALLVFSGCIMKRPDHPYAYFCRGAANYKLGRYPEAIADFSKAIELDDGFVNCWSYRGQAYGEMGQLEKA